MPFWGVVGGGGQMHTAYIHVAICYVARGMPFALIINPQALDTPLGLHVDSIHIMAILELEWGLDGWALKLHMALWILHEHTTWATVALYHLQ